MKNANFSFSCIISKTDIVQRTVRDIEEWKKQKLQVFLYLQHSYSHKQPLWDERVNRTNPIKPGTSSSLTSQIIQPPSSFVQLLPFDFAEASITKDIVGAVYVAKWTISAKTVPKATCVQTTTTSSIIPASAYKKLNIGLPREEQWFVVRSIHGNPPRLSRC